MPGSTGPDKITYSIPEVQLGDTFNFWRDASNTAIYKLNKLRVYDMSDTSSAGTTYTTAGVWSVYLLPTVSTGHTFSGLIRFTGGISAESAYVVGGLTVGSSLNVIGGISASGCSLSQVIS